MSDSADFDERSLSEDELGVIQSNYKEIVRDWKTNNESYEIDTLQRWHRKLYADVRPAYAGRLRSPSFGASVQMLGRYRSVESKEVMHYLQQHLKTAATFDSQIVSNSLATEEIIRGAIFLHCDLIAIQPFHDGNKITSRLSMSYWLRKWSIPVPILSFPRQEYLICINSFLEGDKTCQAMLDLVIRLIDDQTR